MSPAPNVRVGVHLDHPATDLAGTLESLRGTPGIDLVVLLDGVSPAALPDELPRLEAWGPAACFNRLTEQAADLYVFFEAGARASPGWLDALRAALAQAPDHGLAGPSTNLGWNEQALGKDLRGDPAAVAAQLRRWHPGQWRSLEPLYSLGDFCYAVRHEVIEAVGGADPAYGTGPCWELDLNARAARAGWRGVWALDAYVHRTVASPTRVARERVGFQRSRRLYQDRLCGRRLGGRIHRLAEHCEGDACPDFAPSDLVQIRVDRAPAPSPPAPEVPLVSCVMVTRGRPAWVAQAIGYFDAQGWPHKELVIVHEAPGDLPPLPSRDDVRATQLPPPVSLGEKRNHGAALARGTIIAQWDDDDWYGPERLSRQVAPIVAGEADLTALRDVLFCDLPRWRFWLPAPSTFAAMCVGDVLGGTLVFHRRCFDDLARYPALSLAEDAGFLSAALAAGARMRPISGRGAFVYMRHGHNTWRFEMGPRSRFGGWRAMPEPDLGGARAHLRAHAGLEAKPPPITAAASAPSVSCIMPTTGSRRALLPEAIAAFLAQDFADRELLIIEDGNDSVADLVPDDPRIRYRHAGAERLSIGRKRNIACLEARGSIIVHWDDDDWMAPGWISAQVAALRAPGVDVVGLDRFFAFDPRRRTAWEYRWPAGRGAWVHGGTLCYTRATWQAGPFPDISVGEDWVFQRASVARRIRPHQATDLYVARVHADNTSPKDTTSGYWRPLPASTVEPLITRR